MKKKHKLDIYVSLRRFGLAPLLMAVVFVYFLYMSVEIPLVFRSGPGSPFTSGDSSSSATVESFPRQMLADREESLAIEEDKHRPLKNSGRVQLRTPERRVREFKTVSDVFANESVFDNGGETTVGFSIFHQIAKNAISVGKKTWVEIESGLIELQEPKSQITEKCPDSVTLSGLELVDWSHIMVMPCGLTLGSHITVVATPRWAQAENETNIKNLKEEDDSEMATEFMMELLGLKTVDGEDPPRIFHYNPRIKGDWSGHPVIEQNTCYRMQWGLPLRCDGRDSPADNETVDGEMICEKWTKEDDEDESEKASVSSSRSSSWLSGQRKKMKHDWPFPFEEGKLFVLTLHAGMEGYHVSVNGRHITSFPYRSGFGLEDATGFSITGDIDIHSIVAASLPSMHPSFDHLEMKAIWKAPPLPEGPVEMFVGIISSGNHFAERMAVRKSWMQHELIKSSQVVARFFVALNERNEINVELKKEAEYFGDIVIVPYMDHYDLVVLKTIAICEYGVRTMEAKYIMKCDDDTFVRLDAVLLLAKMSEKYDSVYIGNMNFNHGPLRSGKWAVTYEEWPDKVYPTYANGPGYVLSSDIAKFIIQEMEEHKLRLFKMEDVSVGMWVDKYRETRRVGVVHSLKFCQFGCIQYYFTAHYQSPGQMVCMWDMLKRLGKPLCCDMTR